MEILFNLVAKVIPFIIIGWILAKLKFDKAEIFLKYFIDFAMYFLFPVFMFFAMWSAPIKENLGNSGNIILVAAIIIFFGAVFALAYSRIFNMEFRNVALPIIFMNSAYLAIPLNTVFFGSMGTFYSILYNIIIAFFHFSVGLWIVSSSLKEVVRLPILYFAIFGILLNLTGNAMPTGLSRIPETLNIITLPIMLCFVGYQIKSVNFGIIKKILAAVSVRMVGGFIIALSLCEIFGLTGAVRGVCLISSSMPSAVNTYILTKKYDADSSFASSMIAVGTALSVFFIPVVLWII
ncbi:MAG: hypothetical protein JW983_02280 [Elusimicrobia bacterium]|nr:hypothetical protein [Elusimicrobiota bacterium]